MEARTKHNNEQLDVTGQHVFNLFMSLCDPFQTLYHEFQLNWILIYAISACYREPEPCQKADTYYYGKWEFSGRFFIYAWDSWTFLPTVSSTNTIFAVAESKIFSLQYNFLLTHSSQLQKYKNWSWITVHLTFDFHSNNRIGTN